MSDVIRKFPHMPCTVERGDWFAVAELAEYFDTATPPVWSVQFSDYEVRGFLVAESLVDTPEEVRFVDPDGLPVTIRHVVESDSEAGNHPFFPNYPLPVEVIGAIMAGTQGPPELFAVVDVNGAVNTLALSTNTGMYVRYGRAWHEANTRALIGKALVPVSDLEVEAYDQADETGRQLMREQVTVTSRSAPPIVDVSPVTAAVTASAPIVMPIIASLDDVGTALEWATDNPESRFYVEKRARALGFTDPFPWEQ